MGACAGRLRQRRLRSTSTSRASAPTRCTATTDNGTFTDATRAAGVGSLATEHELRLRRRRPRRRPRPVRRQLRRPQRVDDGVLRRHTGSAPTATRESTSRCPASSTATTATERSPTSRARRACYTTAGNGLGVVFGDYDDDGWPDVFVANDSAPNFLFHNEGRGVFSEVGLLAGVAVASDGKPRAGMGTDFGDYDGDGRLDLFVTNHEFETHNLFRNLGGGLFADATFESGIGAGHPAVRRLRRASSSTTTTTATSTWRSPTGTCWTTPGTSAPSASLRAAQSAVAQRRRAGSETSAAPPGPGFAIEKVEPRRWPPATSTTTATSTCWSPTTASRRSAAQRRREPA